MTAIHSPSNRVWWKQPLDRVEGTWIAIAFAWCLIMFFMMPYWHVYGKQNLSNEAYRTTPEMFQAKAQAMVDKYKVREETDLKIPVVAPPAGSDVYLIARLWQWWPMVELEEGKTYRLHLVDGLAARVLAAAREHQRRGPPGLRARDDGHADQGGDLLDHLQRVLRHQPSHDGEPPVRRQGQVRGR